MTRYYSAVYVPATQAPAMILAGWHTADRYQPARWPVWMHRYSATAAEAIAHCETPGALSCLAEQRPGGTLIWPRGDGLDAAAAIALHDV